MRWWMLGVAPLLFGIEFERIEVARGFRNYTAASADFTGDGLADVITNDHRRVMLFIAPDWRRVDLFEGGQLYASEVMDVDRDGDLDYIGGQYSPGWIFWLECPKDPARDKWTYHLIDSYESGGVDGVHGLLVADVDGDGRLDLVANSAQSRGEFPHSLVWYRRTKDPSAVWERHVFGKADAPGLTHYFAVGDINEDNRLDIATAAKDAPMGNWFAWWEAPEDPRRAWKRHWIATGQMGATNVAITDVNGDGRADVVGSRGHGKGIVWFEGPDWRAHEIDEELEGPHSLAVADLDGDGDADVVTCAKDSKVVAWFENDGRGQFARRVIATGQAAYDLRLADMDGDKRLDILIAGQYSENVVWFRQR